MATKLRRVAVVAKRSHKPTVGGSNPPARNKRKWYVTFTVRLEERFQMFFARWSSWLARP